jgi:hypothetical protein
VVTHTCNPGYSGGREKEDHGLRPAMANSSRDPILKKLHKKGLVEWFKVESWSSNSSTTKKKENANDFIMIKSRSSVP